MTHTILPESAPPTPMGQWRRHWVFVMPLMKSVDVFQLLMSVTIVYLYRYIYIYTHIYAQNSHVFHSNDYHCDAAVNNSQLCVGQGVTYSVGFQLYGQGNRGHGLVDVLLYIYCMV